MTAPVQDRLNPPVGTFTDAMEEAGYDVEHYHGRNFWRGPAVKCGRDEFQDVLAAASAAGIRVQWDSLGLGNIVYPLRPEPCPAECAK